MPTLDRIVTKIQTRELSLSEGRTLSVRALLASEQDDIADVFPRPSPPLGKNPLAGSEAPPIPRDDDAVYQKNLRRWYLNLRAAEAVVAIDLAIDFKGGSYTFKTVSERDREEWLREAVKSLKSSMTEPEIRAITDTIERLNSRELVREAIKVMIVERDEDSKLDENAIKIPQNYDYTETGMLVSAAMQLGVGDPFPWIDSLDPGKRAAIIGAELIRRREESAKMEMMMSLMSAASIR